MFKQSLIGHDDILKSLMMNYGISFSDVIESGDEKTTTLSVYFEEELKARRFKSKMQQSKLKGVAVTKTRFKNRDWQTKWKKDFKPLWLSKNFQVVPAWHRDKKQYQKTSSIFIDTSVAFGTGMHATTQFVTQLIEQCAGKFDRFLDIGTGTGILCIAAHKSGAKELSAIDISKDAIAIAKQNFEWNNCEPKYLKAIDFDKFKRKEKYDFVAANLITQDLLAMSHKIVGLMEKGGYLAISGVSLKNYTLIRTHFKKYRLRCLRVHKGEGWTAVLFKKY